MKVICVTGTPGTGKTTIAKKLSAKLRFHYIDVNRLIMEKKLGEGYDKKRATTIVDAEKLNRELLAEISRLKKSGKWAGAVIDSHLSHYMPKKHVNFCIVAKCDVKELNKRLKKKKFSKKKILENLQAEIFDVCHNEALEMKHKVIVINTTKGFNISDVVKQLGGK